MRKFMLMALAALGLALVSPVTASAVPVTGAAINLAADAVSPLVSVAWHCRAWSGWCRSHPYPYYGYYGGPGPYYGHRPYYWHRPYWRRHWW